MEIAIAIRYKILANATVVKSWMDASKPSPANRYYKISLQTRNLFVLRIILDLILFVCKSGVSDWPQTNIKQKGKRSMVKLDQKKGELSL